MTAVSKGFWTRAQLGLRPPKSVSRNITPSNGGTAVHWNGRPVKIPPTANHSKCVAQWQGDQRYHMVTNGWADIAYTGGFCQHGVCLAGRGFGVRTAANGTNVGNQNNYAFCWLGGTGEVPTNDAMNALEWWINEARVHGGAGDSVVAHRSLFSTACPGGILTARAAILNNRPLHSAQPAPTTTKPVANPPAWSRFTLENAKGIQSAVGTTADGKWGPKTDSNAMALRSAATGKQFDTRLVQQIVGVKVDGVFGPKSKAGLLSHVLSVQRALQVVTDGSWGPKTDGAFLAIRKQFCNKY